MTAPGRAVLSSTDVRAAQVVIDEWTDAMIGRTDGTAVTARAALELRGIMAGVMAEVRTAGYLEGVQEGRRDIAAVVHHALEDEGL